MCSCATACSGSSVGSSSSSSTSSSANAARACAYVSAAIAAIDCPWKFASRDELRDRARLEHGANARRLERARRVERLHARACEGRAENRRVQHPRQLEVGRVDRLAARALQPVLALRRLADDGLRAVGPLVERILLDDEPDLFVPALDLFLGADQSRHVRIASSIFGYVPQRQRLPAIACRICSSDGLGSPSTSAAADTICPGVQKPHCDGVGAHERIDERVLAQAFDGRDLASVDRVRKGDARERRHAVDLNRARAAVPLEARDLRAGEPEVLAQHLREHAPDVDVEVVPPAVDVQRQLTHAQPSPPRCLPGA